MVGGIGIKIHHTKFQTNRRQKISFFPSQLFVIVINLELYIPLMDENDVTVTQDLVEERKVTKMLSILRPGNYDMDHG